MRMLALRVDRFAMIAMAVLVPVASLLFFAITGLGFSQMLSEKELIGAYHSMEPANRTSGTRPVYYLDHLPASAVFYSGGAAAKTDGVGPGLAGAEFWLAVHKTGGDANRWNCNLQYQPKRGIFDLYLCRE